MRFAVLVNCGAGGLDRTGCEERAQQIRAAFTAAGAITEIFLCSAARLTRIARQLASRSFDAIVVAGGDGSVSAVAAGLAGTSMPLAVLPFGTKNHFARDLGMPLDPLAAVRTICEGVTDVIDLGEINGHVFVNNSSIGLYPEALVVRDDHRVRHGMRKWSAMLLAAVRVLRRFPLLSVCVATVDRTVTTRTPFVFVGNNDYRTNVPGLGRRDGLDRGYLCLHTVRARGRFAMFRALVRTMLRGKAPALETQRVTEASVIVKRRHLDVALDGELVRLATPLHYRIRPGALHVRRSREEVQKARGAA